MQNFAGKVAVVTGASSGIGRATAMLLAQRGAHVVLFARKCDLLGDADSSFAATTLVIEGDVSSEADVDRLFEATEARFGHCNLLVNCAGMIDVKPVVETTAEAWDRMFAVNVRGTFLTCRRALPEMLRRGDGTIVNVASISGIPGPEKFPGFASYCASKAAVISFTEALAVELEGSGVRANCVSPGSVDTKMWAVASGGAPADMTSAEVAETILFLASHASRPMNGQNLHVYSS